MLNLRRVIVISFFLLSLVAAQAAHAASSGFGSTGETITFFVTTSAGEQTVGTWDPCCLTVNGNVNAMYFVHMSDVRLKTNIEPVNNALNRLLAIQGVTFNWANGGKADMGVIAQNVANVFPQIVHVNSSGLASVEYDSLVAPIIEAIRELKVRNDGLAAEVGSLRAEVYGLREINNRLLAGYQ